MGTNNWRPSAAQGAEPVLETGGDWRTQLPTDARQRIVNRIMESLKKHLPYSGQEGLELELKKIAMRFEEKMYIASISQTHYLRKISLKLLTMESKSQNIIPNLSIPEHCGILMDTNNLRPTTVQGAEPSMGSGVDWRPTAVQGVEPSMRTGRIQLPTDARQRIVNKILEMLKRHIPYSGQEGLEELKKIAVRFEEKMYTAATSQSDYLRKISLKMVTMESKSQTTIPNSLPSNPSGNNNNNLSDFLLETLSTIESKFPIVNQRPTAVQGAEPSVGTGGVDWRSQFPTDARQRIVNKIMETLERHIPYSEGLEELKKIAVCFEGKMYAAATSQSDYLRKIALKMLTMESKSQNTIPKK